MNIKSITTLGLVAVALAVTSLTPAEAKGNNNQAMNQLAMQYYMQNQAAAVNGNNSLYNQAMQADAIMHPIPAGMAGFYNNPYAVVNPYTTAATNYGCNTGYSPVYTNLGYNNAAYGRVVAPVARYRNHEHVGQWRHFGR